MADIKTKSGITCPFYGFINEEEMPLDSCQYFYECGNCMELIAIAERKIKEH